MRIVYITTSGFNDFDFPLIHALQKAGHEVWAFQIIAPYSLRGSLIEIKELQRKNAIIKASEYEEFRPYKDYIDLENFYLLNQTHTRAIHPLNIWLQLKKYWKILNFNPDVVHLINIQAWYRIYPLLFGSKACVTIHDPFPHTGEHTRRKSIGYWATMHFYKYFILLNDNQVDEFVTYYGIRKHRILVNHMGTNDSLRLFPVNKKSDKKRNVLFFGRISPYKGIEYLLEAMKSVHEILPDVTLTIAGGGRCYFDKSVYETLPYINIINRYIPLDELAQLIEDSNVVCCPYTDATQSGVVLSAFALSKPVIATNVGGMGNYIEDGKTGVLVEKTKDAQAIADAIVKYFSEPNSEEQMRANIIKLGQETDLNWDKIAAKYIQFYERIAR